MSKLNIKILGLLLLVILATSCEKWVKSDPRETFQITELDYLRSESDYRTMAISVYTPIQWLNQSVPVAGYSFR